MKKIQTLGMLMTALIGAGLASCTSTPANGVGSVSTRVYESNGMRFEEKREMISANPPAYVTRTTQLYAMW